MFYASAEGPGVCAALVFQACYAAEGASRLETRVLPEGPEFAKCANLIFALEFYAVVPAPRSIEAVFAGASIVNYSDDDAAFQVPTKGGANHSMINRAIRVFRAREARGSLIVWPERVISSINPEDAPSGDRPQPTKISSEQAPPLYGGLKISRLPHLGCCAWQRGDYWK